MGRAPSRRSSPGDRSPALPPGPPFRRPWCWVGKRHLTRALEALPEAQRAATTVAWRPFFLTPEATCPTSAFFNTLQILQHSPAFSSTPQNKNKSLPTHRWLSVLEQGRNSQEFSVSLSNSRELSASPGNSQEQSS